MKIPLPFTVPVLVAIAGLSGAGVTAGATLLDSVNQDAPPANPYIIPSQDLGWLYEPDASYLLGAVQTRFGISPRADYNREVTLEIYSGLPSAGGTLLRSAVFTPLQDAFSGAEFAPLEVTAGQSLFIGFRNIISLGGNITSATGAVSLGAAYSSNDGSYSSVTTNFFTTQPILRFESPSGVPEPDAAGLLLTGLGAAGFIRRRSLPGGGA